MILFVFLALFLIFIFKLIIVVGAPLLFEYTEFDLLVYKPYLLTMTYMMQPMILGMVIGFFMIDEKDAQIFELLRVTPLGFNGYMVNRLLIPVILTNIFMVIAYSLIGSQVHHPVMLIPIGLLLSIQTIGMGIFIALVSEDKVKGLTNTKAISALSLFGFTNLIPIVSVKVIGRLIPQYYIAQLIVAPSILIVLVGILIHVIWLGLIYKRALRHL